MTEQNTTTVHAASDDTIAQRNTALAPAAAAGELVAPQWFGEVRELAFHNLPSDAQERWRLMSLATNGECIPLANCDGQQIDIHYLYIHPVELAGPTQGEIRTAFRCVLISPEEEMYYAVSDGVFGAVKQIVSAYGVGPYKPAVSVQVRKIRTRQGFTLLTLIPAAKQKPLESKARK